MGYGLGAGWIYAWPRAYLTAFAAVASMKIERAPPREPTTWHTLFAGITFIFQRRLLARCRWTCSPCCWAAPSLLPIYAKDILQAGPWALGALRAAPPAAPC